MNRVEGIRTTGKVGNPNEGILAFSPQGWAPNRNKP